MTLLLNRFNLRALPTSAFLRELHSIFIDLEALRKIKQSNETALYFIILFIN